MSNDFNIGVFKDLIAVDLRPIVQLKFPYNINSRLVTTSTAGSGTVTQADSQAVLSTTADINSSSLLESRDLVVYQPGQGVTARFTAVFSKGVVGSRQRIGLGDDTDGFHIAVDGEDFCILYMQNGVETKITEDEFNGPFKTSPIGDLFNYQKGNIYQIEYQWLGYGVIKFSMYDVTTDSYILIHKIDYPNLNTVPSVYNPSFRAAAYVENTTNNTNITLRTPSIGIFVQGSPTKTAVRGSADNSKSITSEVAIFTLRSKATYQGIDNRSVVIPEYLSVSADGTKNVSFRLYLNTTLGGTPVYSDVDSDSSVLEVDTAGTTVSNGIKVFEYIVSRDGGDTVRLSSDIRLRPGESLTITAQSSSSSNVTASLSWRELQ